ncbi:MAG TPA: HYR domain-containing protein [Saprospiraceae bacterium]|nr:HYR domain-containing protein [Saprospiraceae bacterium]HMP24946.1 HYR domain-containing protein [Saprospiraceae bacterium]
MKHTNITTNRSTPLGWLLMRTGWLVVLLLLTGWGSGQLSAQCNMLCSSPDMAAPGLIGVDANCVATVRAAQLLANPAQCPNGKTLAIRDGRGNVIAFETDSVKLDAAIYTNQLLSVTVTDTSSGLFCVSFVVLIDTIAPIIQCEDITMTCIEEATIEIVEFPEVTDNCDPQVALEYQDVITGTPCERVIERTWHAMDVNGNESTCVQRITITRPEPDLIIFPRDTTLDCNTPDTSAVALGQPTLAGLTLGQGALCNFVANYQDSIERVCGHIEYNIHRYWAVTDLCTDLVLRDTQLIAVRDTLPPTITIQELFTVTTNPGQCQATVTLPAPELLDNCDASPRFFVSTSYGAVGLGPHPFVPVGPHTIQYTAVDSCGNAAVFTMRLLVVDNEAPAAICENQLIVALPAVGIVTVPARNFNKGSYDNCAPNVYFKVRKVETGSCDGMNGDDAPQMEGYQEWFDDDVTFCCAEAGGKMVQVILRVYEVNPGLGPVNPARELPGGDLFGRYNECQVAVEVQDKVPPLIKCPKDVTIHCTEDLRDLSRFGSPEVHEICGYTLDSTLTRSLNECGTGTIVRTFIATDNFGNRSTCSQTITIINPTPLKNEDIKWPENYTTNVCGGSTDPDRLPAGFGRPVVTNTSCNFSAVSYSDQFFDIAFPACYKILRTWEIIDWCNYEPAYPERGGKFAKVQTITVEDTEAPVITACPADVVMAASNNCGPVRVNLTPVTANDCSSNVLITNDSPYALSNGADATGNYPVGTTVVTFSVRDRCGNTATCKVRITVEDRTPPAPVCIVGLSMNLVNKDGVIQTTVSAKSFDGGSFDNCTPRHKLKFALRRPGANTPFPPVDTALVFTCADLGNQMVEFWVIDEKGNTDHCVTFISIQDNNRLCPLPATGMVAGGIQTERGDFVENVQVHVNSNAYRVVTGQSGFFEFPYLPLGGDYTVLPERNDNPRNGVSTIDILLISRHLLGIQRFDSPYKMIAADVDRSGDITILDLLRLRRLVLGIDNEFPNSTKSWRFIPADFEFPPAQNPLKIPIPELYNINDFDGNMMNVDFTAVKIGDVDLSARANSLNNPESRATRPVLPLLTEDRSMRSGETTTITLRPDAAHDLLGYQFALHFDADLLEFVNLDMGDLPNMNDANFGLHLLDEGIITTSWNTNGEQAAKAGAPLFHLTLRARADLRLSEALRLNERYLPDEAYDSHEQTLAVQLVFAEPVPQTPPGTLPVEESFELYQNAPNPFATQTVVPFRLPETTYARLTIFDASGRVVYTREEQFPQGYNEVLINRSEVRAEGMLYYRLETLGRQETKKMILLD